MISGPTPCDVMFISERITRADINRGAPFSDQHGKMQAKFLAMNGCDVSEYCLVALEDCAWLYGELYTDEGSRDLAELVELIQLVQPVLIVAVGEMVARCLLGLDLTMKVSHGVLHQLDFFASAALVLPVYPCAFGAKNDRMLSMVFTDYKAAAEAIALVDLGIPLDCTTIDQYPDPVYRDVSGTQLARMLERAPSVPAIGLDAEFPGGVMWSVQVCFKPGKAFMLRMSRDDMAIGVSALQKYLDENQTLLILHNANTPNGTMIDVTMCRKIGLDLTRNPIFDTMYDAYLRRTDPQGLKALGWRLCGVKGVSYAEMVTNVDRQVEYLETCRDLGLDKFKYDVVNPDGSEAKYSPDSMSTRAKKFLKKIPKLMSEGKDVIKEWKKLTGTGERLDVQKEVFADYVSWAGPIPEVSLEDIPLELAVEYGCRDADLTLRLYYARGGVKAYTRIHRDGTQVLKILERMQCNGMPINPDFFIEMKAEITLKYDATVARISEEYFDGRPFNPRSRLQVAELFTTHGIKGKKRTKTGGMSFGNPSIEHLRTEVKLVDLLLSCREFLHTRGNFCDMVLRRADADNVVRCNLASSTSSRRLAATAPNMLAMPNKNRWGWNIRSGFVMPEGYYIGGADYAAQEARMLAHLCGDPDLIQIFIAGLDIHSQTASRVYGKPAENFGKDTVERQACKAVLFGLLYGQSAHALANGLQAKGLDWSVDRCQELMDLIIIELYPRIAVYKAHLIAQARIDGHIDDLWGMRRYVPALHSIDDGMRAAAERFVFNHMIQASSQGQTQRGMIYINEQWLKRKFIERYDADFILQQHDEIDVRTRLEGVNPVRELLLDGMINHCGLVMKVPVKVDVNFAPNWGDVK